MAGPILNLIGFAAVAAAAAVLLWPRVGLVPRLRREHALGKRVLVEDALKHIYHNEQKGQTCTLASIGGALEITAEETVRLVDRMQDAGLAEVVSGRIVLTEEGRRYALQVIRAHRLWERFLADETGIDPMAWHREAERREHTLSPAEADALAARLGDPRFDPHGDPIPTTDGIVADEPTSVLSELGSGERARVVHIEDEPALVYEQILAQGIHPGMALHVVERSDRRLLCSADGREFALAPIVAANVSVTRAPAEADSGAEESADGTLRDLEAGEVAEVVRLSPACRGAERRRLMDLGIVPGTLIEFERRGLSGGLSAYRVRGTVLGLREEQSEMIAIRRRAREEVAS